MSEATQLESTFAIQRLTILVSVAMQTLQIVEGRDNSELSASLTFSDEQQQCLFQLAPSVEGDTEKQQNPYPTASLPWATWLIVWRTQMVRLSF